MKLSIRTEVATVQKTKYVVVFHKSNIKKRYEEEYTSSSDAVRCAMANSHLDTEVKKVQETVVWSSSNKKHRELK